MQTYSLRGYAPDGRFLFGGTLRCEDESAARRKLHDLPVGEHTVELWRSKRRVAVRTPHYEAARAVELR